MVEIPEGMLADLTPAEMWYVTELAKPEVHSIQITDRAIRDKLVKMGLVDWWPGPFGMVTYVITVLGQAVANA